MSQSRHRPSYNTLSRGVLFTQFFLALVFGGVQAHGADGGTGSAVDLEHQRIQIAIRSEPPSLDSASASDQISSFVLAHLMEGLLSYGVDGELVGGVAERWDLRADGASFWLRDDAKWSDGQPVTAADFVYAWRRILAPKTASPYAFLLFPLLNAEKINAGEVGEEELGVRAVSPRHLEVRFSQPCPYFLSLTAFMSYYPLRADWVEPLGRRYASGADTLLFNGPFALKTWVHGARLVLEKNTQYWAADKLRLQGIDIPYVTDDSGARFNLFKDGATAYALLDAETLPEAQRLGLKMYSFSTGTIYYLGMNVRSERVTSSLCLRRAIQSVLDPAMLVNKVIGLPGVRAAYSLFPQTLKDFTGRYPMPRTAINLSAGRRYISCAEAEINTALPLRLQLLTSSSIQAQRQAAFMQYVLERGLGIRVDIDTQSTKQYFSKMRRGEYDIALAGWGPDFDDPMTYGDLFASWNHNNRGGYKSTAYDTLVAKAQTEKNYAMRLRWFAEMQEMLAEDVALIPLYENAEQYVVHPQLRGVRRTRFGGDPSFRHAYVVGDAEEISAADEISIGAAAE